MQIFTMHYNLEFRKLAFYGLTRSQSIKKIETNCIPVVKYSVTRPVTPAVLTTDTL